MLDVLFGVVVWMFLGLASAGLVRAAMKEH